VGGLQAGGAELVREVTGDRAERGRVLGGVGALVQALPVGGGGGQHHPAGGDLAPRGGLELQKTALVERVGRVLVLPEDVDDAQVDQQDQRQQEGENRGETDGTVHRATPSSGWTGKRPVPSVPSVASIRGDVSAGRRAECEMRSRSPSRM